MSGALVWVSSIWTIYSPWSFSFYTICMHYAYIQTAFAFYYSFFKRVAHIYIYRYYNYCKSTPTTCQPRIHPSSIVSSDDVSSLRHIYIYIYTAPSLSFHDKELRNILFPSFFLFFLIHKSSLNESTDRVYKCVLGKILVRNKHSVRQCT